MSKEIELRLIKSAQKVANLYKNRLEQKYYKQLCNAIEVCYKYYVNNNDTWDIMYDVILGDGGIWEYAESLHIQFSQEIQNMWMLITDILICNCYLGCTKEQDYIPEDMEIQKENIPEFVELLEKLIYDKIDYKHIFEFFNKKICYS